MDVLSNLSGGWSRVGAIVATKYGTATVLSVRRTDGFYVLRFVHNAVGYFHPDSIVREIKCLVGERVKTRWGMATVDNYYVEDDMYSIALDWRWDNDHFWRMKATTKMFEKLNPRTSSTSLVQSMQKTAKDGYSSFRSSTSSGYASFVTKISSMR